MHPKHCQCGRLSFFVAFLIEAEALEGRTDAKNRNAIAFLFSKGLSFRVDQRHAPSTESNDTVLSVKHALSIQVL
jgi:hypothetical protein